MSMEQTRMAIRTHSFSGRRLAQYPSLIIALLDVKEACAAANALAGDLSQEKADLIAAICQKSKAKIPDNKLKVDPLFGGGGIGINQNINEFIAERSEGRLSVSEINLSQSTADVVHTSLRIALHRVSHIFSESLRELQRTATLKKEKFKDIETMSRTCMRDALPTTLDRLFEGYSLQMARGLHSLALTSESLLKINLGGTVIGSGHGASQGYLDHITSCLRKISGLDLNRRSSLYDAAQNSDDLGYLASDLDVITTGLLKMSRDIRLLASGPISGYSVLHLPRVIKGSSFFTDKVNPTIPETMMQACWRAQGLTKMAREAFNNAELDLNVFEPFAGVSLLEALVSLNFAVRSFDKYCMKKLDANIENCRSHVRKYREEQDGKSKT